MTASFYFGFLVFGHPLSPAVLIVCSVMERLKRPEMVTKGAFTTK